MKGLINLKNTDHKCFMWCHVRMLHPQNKNAKRINKQDKRIAANLNYSDIEFPLDIDDYELIKKRFEVNIDFLARKINCILYTFQKILTLKHLIYC